MQKALVRYVQGRPWNKLAIYRVLNNPEYAGHCTWGRTTQRLHTKSIHLPRSEWHMKPGCFEPIIDESTFVKAQKILLNRCTRPRSSDEELILKVKRVLARHGRLSERIINASCGAYHERTYWRRFGSLLRAYEPVGFKVSPQLARTLERCKNLRTLRAQVSKLLCELFPEHVRLISYSWYVALIHNTSGC